MSPEVQGDRPYYAVHVCSELCLWDTGVLEDLTEVVASHQGTCWHWGAQVVTTAGLWLQCGAARCLLLLERVGQAEPVKGSSSGGEATSHIGA